MGKYTISLDGEIEIMLKDGALKRNITPQQFIEEVVNRYLPLMHIINKEEMAKGYVDMAEINLDLAK